MNSLFWNKCLATKNSIQDSDQFEYISIFNTHNIQLRTSKKVNAFKNSLKQKHETISTSIKSIMKIMSYKKQKLLTFREHPSPLPVFSGVSVAHLFLCCSIMCLYVLSFVL
jgi:hypothetical protein